MAAEFHQPLKISNLREIIFINGDVVVITEE